MEFATVKTESDMISHHLSNFFRALKTLQLSPNWKKKKKTQKKSEVKLQSFG